MTPLWFAFGVCAATFMWWRTVVSLKKGTAEWIAASVFGFIYTVGLGIATGRLLKLW